MIGDLDGTFCDNSHRQNLLPTGEGTTTADWVAFNGACRDDEPIAVPLGMWCEFYTACDEAILLTGRGSSCAPQTKEWLGEYGVPYDELIMRPEGDNRKATDFKREQFERLGLTRDDIVFEDDPAVIAMLRNDFECIVVAVPSGCSAVQSGVSNNGDGTRFDSDVKVADTNTSYEG
ncbi:putative polynucleotide kinase [Vibrio phage vB_VspS_VS-ABTNL-3]|nr:putative polynucleotide kinase [Vibrio phage vB_VspS_VS-ABTNL-3]